ARHLNTVVDEHLQLHGPVDGLELDRATGLAVKLELHLGRQEVGNRHPLSIDDAHKQAWRLRGSDRASVPREARDQSDPECKEAKRRNGEAAHAPYRSVWLRPGTSGGSTSHAVGCHLEPSGSSLKCAL